MPALRQPSKRQTIKDRIVRWIKDERLLPGEQIMSQTGLAAHFGAAEVTVHKALSELAAAGVLHRRSGAGTFVGPAPAAESVKSLCLVLPGENLDQPEYNPDHWPYVQRLFRAFLETCGEKWNFNTRVVLPDTAPQGVANSLAQHDVVFFLHAQRPRELMKYLIRRKILPVVAFGSPDREFACLTVDHDWNAGVRLGVSYLAELGYREIAFVGSGESWGDIAFDGYRQALADFGLAYAADRVVRVGENPQEGFRGASILLQRDLPCDAVFVDSDMRALNVVECLRQRGVDVPAELGVMGYDGLENAVNLPPYLTSVRVPYRKMITAALAELEHDNGRMTPHKHLEFVGEVLPGRTCTGRLNGLERRKRP